MNSADLIDIESLYKDTSFCLEANGSSTSEGFVTSKQKEQFINLLSSYPKIETIYEIGLNAGHSASILINYAKGFKKFVSFDINQFPYTRLAADFFKKELKESFEFIEGDSLKTIPQFANKTQEKADLIYIDGNHIFDFVFMDILNCKSCAHENTILWIDDLYEDWDVVKACDKLCDLNVIEIINYHYSRDPIFGCRIFAEARYIF